MTTETSTIPIATPVTSPITNGARGRRDPGQRCPKCSGAMAERSDITGKHLRCLNWKHCPGRLPLEDPAPVGASRAGGRAEIDARLELTKAALTGIATNPQIVADGWSPLDVATAAVRLADETLAHLKATARKDHA